MSSGAGVVVLGTVHAVDGLNESSVGLVEVVSGVVHSVSPDLADVHGVSESFQGGVLESEDVSVGTRNSGMLSVSLDSVVDGTLEYNTFPSTHSRRAPQSTKKP